MDSLVSRVSDLARDFLRIQQLLFFPFFPFMRPPAVCLLISFRSAIRTILLDASHHDEGPSADCAYPHGLSADDGIACLLPLQVAMIVIAMLLPAAFWAVKRARSSYELSPADDALPDGFCIRSLPALAAIRTEAGKPSTEELLPAVLADMLYQLGHQPSPDSSCCRRSLSRSAHSLLFCRSAAI